MLMNCQPGQSDCADYPKLLHMYPQSLSSVVNGFLQLLEISASTKKTYKNCLRGKYIDISINIFCLTAPCKNPPFLFQSHF